MDTIKILNAAQPGKSYRVNKVKFEAMKMAVIAALPTAAPGLTVEELYHGVLPHLPGRLFPGGKGIVWWMKAVQLDLEARKIISRGRTKPLRLHRSALEH